MHGDLHSKNILITKHEGPESNYFIIDFAEFRTDVPLLLDNAYLELDIFQEGTNDIPVSIWIQELIKLQSLRGLNDLHKSEFNSRRISGAESIISIRHAIKSWVEQKYKTRRIELYKQEILARVAAGLLFFCRRSYNTPQQIASLIYAASALRYYFEYCNLELPDATCKLIDSDANSDTEQTNTEVSEYLDYFETETNDYVLISTLNGKNINNTYKEIIAKPRWSLIVDLKATQDKESFERKIRDQINEKGLSIFSNLQILISHDQA